MDGYGVQKPRIAHDWDSPLSNEVHYIALNVKSFTFKAV